MTSTAMKVFVNEPMRNWVLVVVSMA